MVEDVDGNIFLDCSAGLAVNATGHSHRDVVRAIATQAMQFVHMSGTDFYYDVQVRLAEELAAIVPVRGGVKSFFGNSGTEAIEAAIEVARYSTGRAGIIAFHGGFHGRTMGELALTGSQMVQRRGFGPLMPSVYHAPYPYILSLPIVPDRRRLRCRVPGLRRAAALSATGFAGRNFRRRRRTHPRRKRLRGRPRPISGGTA